jgi:hypothetical protein
MSRDFSKHLTQPLLRKLESKGTNISHVRLLFFREHAQRVPYLYRKRRRSIIKYKIIILSRINVLRLTHTNPPPPKAYSCTGPNLPPLFALSHRWNSSLISFSIWPGFFCSHTLSKALAFLCFQSVHVVLITIDSMRFLSSWQGTNSSMVISCRLGFSSRVESK